MLLPANHPLDKSHVFGGGEVLPSEARALDGSRFDILQIPLNQEAPISSELLYPNALPHERNQTVFHLAPIIPIARKVLDQESLLVEKPPDDDEREWDEREQPPP